MQKKDISGVSLVFKNKLIVLSGGMKGLGEALAKVLNNNFATVVVTSRNIDFNPNKIQIGSINAQNLDVTNEASIDRFFSWLSQQEIPLSAFINNAGIGVFKEFIELSILEIKSVIDTNLTGAFMCSQHAVKIMKEQNYGGRIIHIGSIVELGGLQLNSIYLILFSCFF